MIQELIKMFNDPGTSSRIKSKLPLLFHIANLEATRAGKIGMEVGTIREKILSSLLIYYFGEENVDTRVPATEAETDVLLFGQPISIKTITVTGKGFSGVKLSWTVDAASAQGFTRSYSPGCDLIFARICWGQQGALYYIPKEEQIKIFRAMGVDNYLKLPKPGTNPRGVEITGFALQKLCKRNGTQAIAIAWVKPEVTVNVFKRWVDLWAQE